MSGHVWSKRAVAAAVVVCFVLGAVYVAGSSNLNAPTEISAPVAQAVPQPVMAPVGPRVVIYPYDGARVLPGQRFDVRAEAEDLPGSIVDWSLRLDGRPLQNVVQTSGGAGKAEWTLRNLSLSEGTHRLEIRFRSGRIEISQVARVQAVNQEPPQRRAKNVILFVGDGMGWNTVNAARIIARGYDTRSGMPRGLLAMESDLDGMASIINSSLDSFVADSANSASSIASGQKIEVNALNVYPDNTADTLDNPRIEIITEILKRTRGAGVGIVTNTFGTDATPAAFAAHTRRRADYQAIADQYFTGPASPDVIMVGGSRDFIPRTTPGSRRRDTTDWTKDAQARGFSLVLSRSELQKVGAPQKLFGLFHIDNFPSYLDRAQWKRREMLGSFTDLPYIWEMTQKAVEVLSQNPNGFFLVVESGMVDKYLHPLDWHRATWDVIELDRAVAWAKDWAKRDGNTLVIVTADHGHAFTVFGGYDQTRGPGNRDAVGVYQDAGFPTYGDQTDANGIPRPETARGLAAGFGGTPDYCESFAIREVYRAPTVSASANWVPNPETCREPGAWVRTGNLPRSASQGVHTADPTPLFAWGPGAQFFHGVMDQTQIFFVMARALGLTGEKTR